MDELLQALAPWLEYYGDVEELDGEKFCTQLDHGDEEYEQRIVVIEAARNLAARR